jgi:hypothetical protein
VGGFLPLLEMKNAKCSKDLPRDHESETLSIAECREILKRYTLTDQQIEKLRDNLSGIVERIINSYLDNLT